MLFVSLGFGGAASAQPNPSFKYATKDDRAAAEKAEQVKWEAAAQAGLILTTGNSRATAYSGSLTASRTDKHNKLALEASAAYARSSIFVADDTNGNGMYSADEIDRVSTTSTNAYAVKARYDRFLTASNALFAAAGVAADRPAGKELVGNGQVGYSRSLAKLGPHSFVGEAGYDFTFEDQVAPGDPIAIHSLRGFLGYKGELSDDTLVESSVEGLFNMNSLETPAGEVDAFGDDRVNTKLALTTKLGAKLSFRFSFEARYDSAPAARPPLKLPFEMGFVPVAEKLDTKAEATLIVTLL